MLKPAQLYRESWFLVPYVLRMKISKDTNKIYVPHRIATNKFQTSVVIINQYGLIHHKILIKKIRAKSIVLKSLVRKGERIMVVYEYWDKCFLIGAHKNGFGWNAYGVFCGECNSDTCDGCPYEFKLWNGLAKETIERIKEETNEGV